MIKETRSLMRLLRARLHKGATHQWFLNQYVKKHKLESSIICNKALEYDQSKRLISFNKHHPVPKKLKIFKQQYSVETATFIVLKDITQVGGGWLGTIVMCSSCIMALYSVWSIPKINLTSLESLLTTMLLGKLDTTCACGQEQRKILTACKPIYITVTHENTKKIFGLISNSFLIPKLLYDIQNLVYTPANKFRQLTGIDSANPNQLVQNSSPLFESLLQLMFFWLKTGPRSSRKLFQYHIIDYLKLGKIS